MNIYLIRHSITEGNLHKRYIGSTDQPLCDEGIRLVRERKASGSFDIILKKASVELFSSPLKRCQETLALLYPEKKYLVIDDLRECDFGLFENKNYLELTNFPEYQKWVDSNGTLPFPQGESVESFNKRCQEGFLRAVQICQKNKTEDAVFFVHGGTIMAIMDAFADSEKTYYDYMVPNAAGFQGVFMDGRITEFSEI